MTPAPLWTDVLVWLLVAVSAAYAWYASGREHLRAPWRRVARSAIGMSAAVVLSVYLCIGLLDSLHYRRALDQPAADGSVVYSAEVRSALDALLETLRTRTEKTYSAPLATRAYAKETIESGGRIYRDYPRLVYGGAHLKDEGRWASDVATRAAVGALIGIAVWIVLAAAFCGVYGAATGSGFAPACRAIAAGHTNVRWRAVLATLALILLIAGPVASLAAEYHVLGTDKVGQDVLFLSLKSIRTALVIGTLTTLVTLPLAVLLGIAAGYFRGWIDDAIQYVYTTLNSIPDVLLIAAAVLMTLVFIDSHPDLFPTGAYRADFRLLILCLILGVTNWTGLARLLRGEALKLRELEYVQAAQAFGVRSPRIITRHILPNVMHIVLISVVMDFSKLVLAEAVLSYIGVGVDPSMTSFGMMINAARLEMAREPMVWWSLASAFVFMFVLVLSANLFADVVRDAFDPRLHFARAGARALAGARA